MNIIKDTKLLSDDMLELDDIESAISSNKWVQTELGDRDRVYAKRKHDGLVHVIHFYYDEDGFRSRDIYVGATYEEAISQPEVFFHWETFEPMDFD